MTITEGADVAALRELGGELRSAAEQIRRQASQLGPAVTNTRSWLGPDGDQFRNLWRTRHQPALARAAEQLEHGRDVVLRNAAEQEVVSGAGGTPGASSTGTTGTQGASAAATLLGLLPGVPKAISVITKGLTGSKLVQPLRSLLEASRLAAISPAARSASVFITEELAAVASGKGGMLSKALNVLDGTGRLFGVVGKVSAVAAIGFGLKEMAFPDHDSWRGAGDRLAGGLSVISGVGSLALLAGATGPLLPAVVVGAGLAAAAWQLGNWAWDNPTIHNAVTGAAGWVAESVSKVPILPIPGAPSIGEAVGKVGGFVKGLFG
jgi:hypothetical protein